MQQIYVVDDNPVAAMRLSKAIDRAPGHNVITFTDPLEALKRVISAPPDLMLIDYAMPGMDGVKLMSEMRRGVPDFEFPIAMVSGRADPLVRSRALQAGALDIIAKPFDVAEIGLKVRNMLALKRSHRLHPSDSGFLDTQPSAGWVIDDGGTLELLERVSSLRDDTTGKHTSRMARYSHAVAQTYGLSVVDCEVLLRAAPLHDIGKVGIPDAILLKPGTLTEEEWVIMRNHTWIGCNLLKGSASAALQLGAQIALNHHEQWNGSGYPRGLSGTDIPLAARIVAISDAFDALTSVRPYKCAWTLDKAMRVIRADSGEHFDPQVVAAFEHSLPQIIAIKRELDGEAAVAALLGQSVPSAQLLHS